MAKGEIVRLTFTTDIARTKQQETVAAFEEKYAAEDTPELLLRTSGLAAIKQALTLESENSTNIAEPALSSAVDRDLGPWG